MVEMRIVSSFKGLICSLATLSLLGQWLLLDVNIPLPFYLLDQLKTQFKRGFLMVLTTHHGYDQRSSILNLKERCGDPDLHPAVACTGLILSVTTFVGIIGKWLLLDVNILLPFYLGLSCIHQLGAYSWLAENLLPRSHWSELAAHKAESCCLYWKVKASFTKFNVNSFNFAISLSLSLIGQN